MEFELEAKQKVEKAIADQLVDIDKVSSMSSIILSLCLIDALAGFYKGYDGQQQRVNKQHFNNFVTYYLPSYKDFLHDLRCRLVHNFSNISLNLMFVDNEEFLDKFKGLRKIFSSELFNVKKYRQELRSAVNRYFSDLNNQENIELQSNFMIRYKALGIIEDGLLPTMTNLDGDIISHVDEADKLPGTNIPIAMYNPTKIKK